MLRKQRPTSVLPHFEDELVSVTYNTSAVPVSPTQTVRVCYLAVVTPRIRDCVLPLCSHVLTTPRFLVFFFLSLSFSLFSLVVKALGRLPEGLSRGCSEMDKAPFFRSRNRGLTFVASVGTNSPGTRARTAQLSLPRPPPAPPLCLPCGASGSPKHPNQSLRLRPRKFTGRTHDIGSKKPHDDRFILSSGCR